MNKKGQKIEELLSGLKFSFSEGFTDRLMRKITEPDPFRLHVSRLSGSISRLFYWVNIPGLAAAIAILVMLLLSGNFGTASYKSQYTSTFIDFLNNYYHQLIK